MSRIHEEDIKAIKQSGFDECVDHMLEIIDKLDNENMGLPDWSDDYEVACKDFRTAVEALKGGEHEISN